MAIASDDYHNYFAYFIASERLRYAWINAFFERNLNMIADKIGPNGVIVTPTPHAASEYSTTLTELIEAFDPYNDDPRLNIFASSGPRGRFLHSGLPFLVISRRPIYPDMPCKGEDPNFVALNLAAVHDETELTNLVDTLIRACINKENDILPLISGFAKDLSKQYSKEHEGWQFNFEDTLELKPNIMGIGLNFNSVIRDVQKAIQTHRARKINKKLGPL